MKDLVEITVITPSLKVRLEVTREQATELAQFALKLAKEIATQPQQRDDEH